MPRRALNEPDNWMMRERLRIIERAFWWRGWVRRSDLTTLFGISDVQASTDLQKYLELNPGALNYHTSRKRYEAVEGSQWVVSEPNFEEAISAFLAGGERVLPGQVGDGDRIGGVGLPLRLGKLEVTRYLMMAVLEGLAVEIRYFSVSSGKHHWRKIYPHSFGNDGYRWHARAYCDENEDYRDFTLSRIKDVRWPERHSDELPVDEGWEEYITIQLRPHRDLDENQRKALALDYGIGRSGLLKLKVRKAMEFYLKHHLKVVTGDSITYFEEA